MITFVHKDEVTGVFKTNPHTAIVYLNYNMICALDNGKTFKMNGPSGRYFIEVEIKGYPTKSIEIILQEDINSMVYFGIDSFAFNDTSRGNSISFGYKGNIYMREEKELPDYLQDAKVCSKCGSIVNIKDAKFCNICGNAFNDFQKKDFDRKTLLKRRKNDVL